MQGRRRHRWTTRDLIPLGALLLPLLATPVFADGIKCIGPYTLNSNNYAPDTTGDDVEGWAGDFSVNLGIASGTLTVTVESKLPNGTFASLGQMTSTSLAQFHGPLKYLRFLVTDCSSCNATIVACAARAN